MKQKRMLKIGEAARYLNVSTSAVRKYANDGVLPCEKTPKGQRVFDVAELDKFAGKDVSERIVFYTRSSKGSNVAHKAQYDELLENYGEPVKYYKDNGSGLNENRKQLQKMISDAKNGDFNKICVTHSDRLTRFGLAFLQELFSRDGVEMVILHDDKKTVEDELMSDFMNLIASFSGKYYRMRSKENQNKLLDKAKEVLNENSHTSEID